MVMVSSHYITCPSHCHKIHLFGGLKGLVLGLFSLYRSLLKELKVGV